MAAFGRKRNLEGGSDELYAAATAGRNLSPLGTYFDRFESQPPEEVRLNRRQRAAFRTIEHAISEAQQVAEHRNSGRRITKACGCERCSCKARIRLAILEDSAILDRLAA